MADNYIPQVDYTSRDYAAIRQDLIDLIPNFAPQWINRDPADFGMTLIELFSYMGDLLNYYIDRSANESFITTASQRNSVLQIANLLGYVPTDSTAATVTLTFQNSTASPIVVPALTQVATTVVSNGSNTQVIFETDGEITVPAKVGAVNGSETVTATQGETITEEFLGNSTGSATQVYQLAESPVINNSIYITIDDVAYTKVDYLIDYSGYDPVFSTYTDSQDVTYVTFGDNISGRIPPAGAQIYATYRTGGGVVGNVASNTIKYIINTPGIGIPTGLSVLNQDILLAGDGAASGGSDPESTDSIRTNAPLSVKALTRAVSLSDYSQLTLQVSGVAKAITAADVYTSATIYFAPFGDKGVESDGVTPSAVFNSLSQTILEYLIDKAPANTTISFQPPSYVPVDVIINLTVLPQYRSSIVQASVESIIQELLLFDNVSFADRITLQDVMTVVSSIDGVSYCSVKLLCRQDGRKTYSVNNKELSANTATLTTSVPHAYVVGDTVLVSDVDSTFNGTFVVNGVTSNTFSYALVASTVSSTAVSPVGSVTQLTVNDVVCGSTEIPELGDLTVTTTGGIVI